MEQHSKDLLSSTSEGSFNIPPVSAPQRVGIGAWRIPLVTDSGHASLDASLFSSSLPVLPHDKFNSTDSEHYGESVEGSSPSLSKLHQDDAGKDPLDEVELNAIGSFLPDDEEELFAGLIDDFDLKGLPSQLEDMEDYDLFGSGGGMELDFDTNLESLGIGISKLSFSDGVSGNGISQYGLPNGVGTVAGEHPYGEHPSRTLFVRNINSNVEDSELRTLFEQYGDIRTLYTACKHRGFVMISYYDIRAARTAMRALQNKPLRRRKLDIHFSIPKDNPSEKDINQGTLVVFNLDASVSNDDLRLIFGAYGEVKEIRETPHKRHHKFIEYYDVRAAEAALKSLNRSDIAGKRIKLEPSRPGGARRSLMHQLSQELEQDEVRSFRHQLGSPVANSPPGSWAQFSSPVEHNTLQSFNYSPGSGTMSPISSNHLPGLASILSPHGSNSGTISPIGKDQGRINQVFNNARSTQGVSYQHSSSFPEQQLSRSPGPISSFGDSNSNSASSGIGTLSGPQFLWGSPTPFSECATAPTSASPASASASAWQPQGGFPFPSRSGPFLGSHHVGSAPSGVSLDRRHFGFFPESPEASSFTSQVGFGGGMGFTRNNSSYVMNNSLGSRATMALPGTVNENGIHGFRMMSLPRHGPIFLGNGFYPGSGSGSIGNEALLAERARTRRVENTSNPIDSKKQYQLDLDKIVSGEDPRTTLMIKNIPNKYTSKMLLAAIDENHRGTYDFLYLPIDFKNKCNVGYAFINMVSPSHIISFYEAFNGKKWEKFNSEKVASLAYARIQGKAALITHFQNSSLMNEDKRCRPILFHSEELETADQGPFATNNLNIYVLQPDGSYSGDLLESAKDDPSE